MELREHKGKIYIRNFCFEDIAEEYGTPFYLYDLNTIKKKIEGFRQAFGNDIELFYAVKANPNLEILKAIREDLGGLDISSIGEMEQSLLAGYEAAQLSFAGPGKTRVELEEAIKQGVGIISAESMRELKDIKEIALKLCVRANIAIRINPKLLINEFAIKMGGKATQFGIDEEDIHDAIEYVRQNGDAFNMLGIHIYAGTQCMNEEALSKNILNILEIAWQIKETYGFECRWINFGGGFGVSYYEENLDINLNIIAEHIKGPIQKYKSSTKVVPRLVIELGRYLVSEAGMYVARVISEKKSRGEDFFVLDGGMNHHLAASGNLGAILRKNYLVKNLTTPDIPEQKCNLVGPLCTPLDLMGRNVILEQPKIGDLIGFLNSGSYGFTASPLLFLGHETPIELMARHNEISVIRKRKGISDFN